MFNLFIAIKARIKVALLPVIVLGCNVSFAQQTDFSNLTGEWIFEKAEMRRPSNTGPDSVVTVTEKEKLNMAELPWVETVYEAKFRQGTIELRSADAGVLFCQYIDGKLISVPQAGPDCPGCPAGGEAQINGNVQQQNNMPQPVMQTKTYSVQLSGDRLLLTSEYMLGRGNCIYTVTLKKHN